MNAQPVTLTASPRPNRIVLNWSIADDSPSYNSLVLERATVSGGPYTVVPVAPPLSPTSRECVDTTVTEGASYYYVIGGNVNSGDPISTLSNEQLTSTLNTPVQGSMDIAFIIDNTGSMNSSLSAIQNGIATVLNDIVTASTASGASAPDYRLALVTPDEDQVHVRVNFSQNNQEEFELALLSLKAQGGGGESESTDECLNTVVNALPSDLHGRQNLDNCAARSPTLQINDFAPAFRANAKRIVVLITDASPGGFCDQGFLQNTYDQYATEAANQGIQINAILINDQNDDALAAKIVLLDYYNTTCGWYSELGSSGVGVSDAILGMLYSLGQCGGSVVDKVPIAYPQVVNLSCNQSTSITLVGASPDHGTLTYRLLTNPAHGSLSVSGALPNLTYTRDGTYSGPDYFTFEVSEGAMVSSPATVSINIAGPHANPDRATVFQDTAQVIPVLANDTDDCGQPLNIQSVTQGTHGQVHTVGNIVTYTPDTGPGQLNVMSPPAGQQFTVSSVNASGMACGCVTLASGVTHAALWDVTGTGQITDLDQNGHFSYSIAECINDSGTVVGYMNVGGGIYHAFECSQGGN